jgi:hypothetical protein
MPGRFILSPEFAALNKKYGEHTLRALHQSLNVEDRIAALIRKQKTFLYPEGSSLAGKLRISPSQELACFETLLIAAKFRGYTRISV